MRVNTLGLPAGNSCPAALACAAALLCATAASGQPSTRRLTVAGATPTAIQFNFSGGCAFDEDAGIGVRSVGDLAREYDAGTRWRQLQQDLRDLLASCLDDDQPQSPRDLSGALAKSMLVVFVDKDTPYYVVLSNHQPYSLTIGGAVSVVPVVLVDGAAKRDAPSDLHFMSSRIDDPRQTAIPAFVRDFATVVKRYGVAAEPARKHNPRIWAYAADEVVLPFRRASVAEFGTLTLNCDSDGSKASLSACPRGKDSIDVDITTTFTNTPKTRIDFAAVAGGLVGPYRGHLKMKVDAGRYASDPATQAITMAAVAIHVKAYDSSLAAVSAAERFSVIVGGVLTPAAGVGAGVSVVVIRGLAIDAGEVVIWVPSGTAPGAPAPDGSNQLPHRYSYGPFVAAAYSFVK